ncbi:uncharacterized protein LOC109608778 [Aethina tumida]|uniref:uncharacterized protein LOC109608778 n=1 Tax=Aethina tumida TaxID=116153 RepID=UPI0021472137|nr:uncharacterized protein LOC109608778 [Aethina tumida]
MDNRHKKIIAWQQQVEDEKSSIIASLDVLSHKVQKKLSDGLKKKDYIGIINYEINILKKLSEISMDLDTFIQNELSDDIAESVEADIKITTDGSSSLTVTKIIDLHECKTTETNDQTDSLYSDKEKPVTDFYKQFSESNSQIKTEFYDINNVPSTSALPSLTCGIAVSSEEQDAMLKENINKLTQSLGLIEKLDDYKDYYEKNIHDIPEKDTSYEKSKLDQRESALNISKNTEITKNETVTDNLKASPNDSTGASKQNLSLTSEQECDNMFKCNVKKNCQKKANNKNSFEIPDQNPPQVGTECVFSHVECPDEFYIHLIDEDTITMIDNISYEIEKSLNKKIQYKDKEEAHDQIGKFCVAYTNEKIWCRCEIVNWFLEKETNEVQVQLCDYGNCLIISYKMLQPLTKEVANIPKLAIKCNLPWLYPPGSTHLNRLTKWPEETIETLIQISELFSSSDENRVFKLLFCDKINNSYGIDLYNVTRNCPDDTVGQILIDLGFAVQLFDDLDVNNLEVEEYVYDAQNYGVTDNINEAIQGYDAKDEARICRYTRPDGTCFKGKNCRFEHTPFNKGGFTTDKLVIYRAACHPFILPNKYSTVHILITGYKNQSTFYAQIVNKPILQNESYYMDKLIFNLISSMNSDHKIRSYEKFKVSPEIGEICIAYHWSRKWLRGIIHSLNEGPEGMPVSADIFMLDFGDTVTVQFEKMRQMQEEFLMLPFQAFECYLDRYQPKETMNSAAKTFILENILFKNFMATILSDSLPIKVNISGMNNVNIGDAMYEMDFLEPRKIGSDPPGSYE